MLQPLKNTVLVGPSPRIAVDYLGAGQHIIFLHGIGGNRLNWARAMAALSPQFLVMARDARGYGASDDYLGALTDDDFIADFARVLDYFEIDQCHIVGLSMGVSIAIDFLTSTLIASNHSCSRAGVRKMATAQRRTARRI